MIRHIVAWNFKDGSSKEENLSNAKKVKAELEALAGLIQGVVSINVIIDPAETSQRAVILNSLFESERALAEYQVHPEHKRAGAFIGSVLTDRVCLDFTE